jgi:hypothetical protein
MLLMLLPSMAFYDDFQAYTYITDWTLLANYTLFYNPSFPPLITTAPTSGSIAFRMQLPASNGDIAGSTALILNQSRVNATGDFNFSFTLRDVQSRGSPNAQVWLAFYTNYSIAVNDSRGIIALASPYGFSIRRCPYGALTGTACGIVLNTSAYPYNNFTSGDVEITVTMRSGLISLYANNQLVVRVLETSGLYTDGGFIIGGNTGGIYGYGYPLIDNVRNEGVGGGGANFTVIGYPSLSPNNVSISELVNGTMANWVALNQPFNQLFSFMTPVGQMSQYTELSCPVRLSYEYDYTSGYVDDYPQVHVKATDPQSANRCVRRIEYSYYQPYYNGYLCIAPYMCLFSWGSKEANITIYDQPIGYVSAPLTYIDEGTWRSSYKILDINGKMYYQTVEYVCTAPANLSFAIQYRDRNTCSYSEPSNVNVFEWNVTNIGICPSSGLECDLQTNYSCWSQCNGSTGSPAPTCAGGNCTLPPNLPPYIPPSTVPPTGAEEAGVTNPFDPSQSGSIWTALLSPAFIGLVICIILALMGAVYGGQLIGAMGFIGAFFFMTWWGLFPLWVGLGVIVLASFVTVYMIRDIFTGD